MGHGTDLTLDSWAFAERGRRLFSASTTAGAALAPEPVVAARHTIDPLHSFMVPHM
jgi:hypothetical protein